MGAETASGAVASVLALHPDDPVRVARVALEPGTRLVLDGRAVTVADHVPPGHKVAVRDLDGGEPVRKYGQVIGVATGRIAAGEHVHDHNLRLDEGLSRDVEIGVDAGRRTDVPSGLPGTFLGYRRPDGRVGTRNYVLLVPTVNCASSTVDLAARAFEGEELPPGVDGVIALPHDSGCGMGVGSDGHRVLARVLAGFASHPNVGATIMVSLGCEANQLRYISELGGGPELVPLRGRDDRVLAGPDDVVEEGSLTSVVIQEEGGVRRTVDLLVDRVRRLLPRVAAAERVEVPVAELSLALQCGGSDGYSGITANPALGYAADLIVAQGGTAILGETPEIYGAEHVLLRRATSEQVAKRLLERIDWWRGYAAMHGVTLDANPQPGNRAGGLSTIWEKSLGAIAKLGSSDLSGVVEYAEPVPKGAVVMDTPGYDPVSVTGMVAGGANLVAFTTGRGSGFGFRPAPSLKIATNSMLYERQRDDMDVNAGVITDGLASVRDVGEAIYRELVEVASGKATKSEALGLGTREFVPWHLGAVV